MKTQNWLQALNVYLDRRVLAMLFLGFSSGLPFGVLAEPMTAWLAGSGVDKTTIGLFALVSLPYALKFLWAPIMDRVPLPVVTRIFGRRRGWVLVTQFVLIATIFKLGLSDPANSLWWTAVFALAVSFASASQDIVIDAYRVEILEEDQLAAGAALAINGWRLSSWGGAAVALIFADLVSWQVVFSGLALSVGIGIVAILLNPEPATPMSDEAIALEQSAEDFLERNAHLPEYLARAVAWLYGSVFCPFIEFLTRPNWLLIILFILLYKFGDAVLTVMKIPFFLELGFSNTEIGTIAKLVGFPPIIIGGLFGGLLLAKTGIMRGLLISGIFMAASNLVFVLQSWVGYSQEMLAVTIAIENFTTSMGTVAFVAYLSSLCNIAYTATQYALLTSFMAFSRTVMTSGSGWVADQVSWPVFFMLTTLAALPGLILLVYMIRRFDQAPVQSPD
ncbi:MAG: MFS transporter [Rhodospirillaceae bacterium]|jgi:MFS transporter, PAT family, beta-lactamase induction signal transducer AmpG|nr:MFS transporter [Rhodospirillaceae bacterium]MBT7955349.1 MFS transporter [Rhodospirillaceae bacterium]